MKKPWGLKAGLAVAFVVILLAPTVVCQDAMRRTARHYDRDTSRGDVSLREFPYPARCAVTLSIDVDATRSLSEFLTIQEFLNTENETPLGRGIGLEIASSFFAKDEYFGLVSPHPADRDVIIDLVRLGYVDAIHSFDTATTRDEIQWMTGLLSEADVSVPVWVNHTNAESNLGSCSGCLGDDTGSEAYHADFSLNRLGLEFVWVDAVSGILGQGRPISSSSFFDAFDRRHPLPSLARNVIQEQIKFTLAAIGSSRYSMRKNNELVRVAQLDDGRPVFEFTRSNQCYFGLWGNCATAAGLAETLRESVQQGLVENGGYMIVYTHLGVNDGFPYLPPPTVRALRSLADRSRAGDVWVTTTSRLLRYYVNKIYLQWETRRTGDGVEIVIHSTEDPVRGRRTPKLEELGGLTFYVADPDRTEVLLDGMGIDVVANPPDETGAPSVTIPLPPLARLEETMSAYKSRGYF